MKRITAVAFLFASLIFAKAGIVGTNIINLATYSAGTNASASFAPPQNHSISPATYTFYHSATNAAFPTTNIVQITFDGGTTWANIGGYADGTNTQTEIWTVPNLNLTASTRVLTITTTNQTLYSQANWSQ